MATSDCNESAGSSFRIHDSVGVLGAEGGGEAGEAIQTRPQYIAGYIGSGQQLGGRNGARVGGCGRIDGSQERYGGQERRDAGREW